MDAANVDEEEDQQEMQIPINDIVTAVGGDEVAIDGVGDGTKAVESPVANPEGEKAVAAETVAEVSQVPMETPRDTVTVAEVLTQAEAAEGGGENTAPGSPELCPLNTGATEDTGLTGSAGGKGATTPTPWLPPKLP